MAFAFTFQPSKWLIGYLETSIKTVVFLSLGFSNVLAIFMALVTLKKVIWQYKRVTAQAEVKKELSKRDRTWFPKPTA